MHVHKAARRLRTGSRARRRGGENLSRIITFITSGDHREATKTQLALALAQGGSVTGRRGPKRDSTELFQVGQRPRGPSWWSVPPSFEGSTAWRPSVARACEYSWISATSAAELTYPEASLKLNYSIAGEADPSHSVPEQNPANQEVCGSILT